MKILAIADIHGDTKIMEKILEDNQDADLRIFLGDFEVSQFAQQELANKFDYVVTGNNDYPGISEKTLVVDFDGVKAFLTHGEKYFTLREYVTKGWLAEDALLNGAKLAIHGHDHKGQVSKHRGVTVFNPGSPSYPRFESKASYGIIEVENGKIKRIENIFI